MSIYIFYFIIVIIYSCTAKLRKIEILEQFKRLINVKKINQKILENKFFMIISKYRLKVHVSPLYENLHNHTHTTT